LLRFELSLFRDWLCGRHLGLELTGDRERSWAACCDLLVANALDQPRVFVHRDYHSRNLMVTETANPGILDFQDAVEGPLTYDLVSLLKDCYIRWPAERVRDWALAHFAALDRELLGGLGQQELLARFELMGVQRHLKAAGIFARLCHRDGKAGYLRDVPRTLSYVLQVAPRYPALEVLAHLVQHEVLPRMARVCAADDGSRETDDRHGARGRPRRAHAPAHRHRAESPARGRRHQPARAASRAARSGRRGDRRHQSRLARRGHRRAGRRRSSLRAACRVQ